MEGLVGIVGLSNVGEEDASPGLPIAGLEPGCTTLMEGLVGIDGLSKVGEEGTFPGLPIAGFGPG